MDTLVKTDSFLRIDFWTSKEFFFLFCNGNINMYYNIVIIIDFYYLSGI